MNLPIYLINASLRPDSRRIFPGVKDFLKYVFRDFTSIYAVSDVDAGRLAKHFPRCPVEVTGDTKYDQVVLRKKRAISQNLVVESWIDNQWIFIAGSIWPEDEQHVFPALKDVLNKRENVRAILVPHQPDQKSVENILTNFKKWGAIKFSKREKISNERILVIDGIGYLAGLYHYAHCAYVGGSFRQGIHNAMEPAIFGIPVLFGPVHKNSHEASELLRGHGAFLVQNSNDVLQYIFKFIDNEDTRKNEGAKAEKFALRNTGATERLIKDWNIT
jgi:3-deoxy-D-manno-octulosonic-acid transferase